MEAETGISHRRDGHSSQPQGKPPYAQTRLLLRGAEAVLFVCNVVVQCVKCCAMCAMGQISPLLVALFKELPNQQ